MAGPDARLFLRVVEAGSLKAAAEQTGADASTVSRQLAALESRLGVKLLRRSTRRTTPTDAGTRYYEGLRRIVDLENALEADVGAAKDTPRGLLRVAAPHDFGARFVVPALEKLQKSAPDLSVELILGSGFADLVEQGIDVAVRIGRLPDSSLVARRIGAVRRVLVASRAYLKKRGSPREPEDLAAHDFVLYAPANVDRPMELRHTNGKTASVRIRGRFVVNSVTCIRSLVESGHGIHLGPQWAFEEALGKGRVVEVLLGWQVEAYPLHVVYAASSFVPAKIRAFADLMALAWKDR